MLSSVAARLENPSQCELYSLGMPIHVFNADSVETVNIDTGPKVELSTQVKRPEAVRGAAENGSLAGRGSNG